MLVTPTLYWFGLDDARKGLVHVVGDFTHSEVVREQDQLRFVSVEQPEKYDRVLWYDKQDGRWREHMVREVATRKDGTYDVVADGSLFETELDFLEGFRLEDAAYYKVLDKILPYTRFSKGTYSSGGINSATAWITRKSVLQGLRKLEQIYNIEFLLDIEVDEERMCVAARKLTFVAEQGAWRGLRFVRGRNLRDGSVRVGRAEVITALYGYGASFGAYDEEGNATGGFTRRLTFGEVNGGKDYVEDVIAREKYGRVGSDGRRRNNVGYVIYDDIEKKPELYRRTHAALQELNYPRLSYEVEGELALGDLAVGFGDVVLCCDVLDGAAYRCGKRIVSRRREFSASVQTFVKLGDISAGTRSHFTSYENKYGAIATFDDALVKAGLKEPEAVEAVSSTLGISLALRSAKRADGTDIDLRYTYELAVDDVYRYDLKVRNNLKVSVGQISIACAAAGINESNLIMAAGTEKLYVLEVNLNAAAVAEGHFECAATASAPAGNVGFASEYAACTVSAAHSLPLSNKAKPVNTIPTDLAGNGTFANPYTVAALRRCVCVSSEESALEDVWISGYIVGFFDTNLSYELNNSSLRLSADGANASNIVLADSASETDVSRMAAVNLSTATRRRKAVRAVLNLQDNSQLIGTKVWVQGDVLKYGGQTGMKRADEYRYCKDGYWQGWATYNGQLFEDM